MFSLFLSIATLSTSGQTASKEIDIQHTQSAIKELKIENKKILETEEDVKPPRINFQIVLETKEDAKNINRILSSMNYRNWSLSIFTTKNFAKENEDFIKSLHERGYEIGLLLEESILRLSYEEQLEIINSSYSYLSSLIKAPILHLRIKEYTVEFKEIDNLLKALQELEFESITAHFLVDQTFRCWQCIDLGFIVHPMHVGYGEVVAVPIGYLPEENVLLVDELIFQDSTSEEFLYYLLLKYNETTVSKLPFAVILHPGTMVSDETRLDALDEFLTHVKETDGQLVDTSFMAQIANQYMSALTAQAGTEIKCPEKKLTIKGTFTTTKSCPTYYIRVYGKYEKQWLWKWLGDYSCAYPTCTVGTYNYNVPITIPKPPKDESKLQIWVLGRGCWPATAGCDYPYLLWFFGWFPITERQVKFDVDVLTIKKITVTGIPDANNPETGNQVRLEAELSDNTGAEVTWTVESKRRITTSPHGPGNYNNKPWPPDNKGRILTYTPDLDTHGDKRVIAKVKWTQGGQECKKEKDKDFRLFFRKMQSDYTVALFGGPNWFGYWSSHDDSATPSWDHTSATYVYGGNGGDAWAEYDGNRVNPTYTIYDRGPTDCSLIHHAPAQIALNGIRGVDCLEVVLEHERWHPTVDNRRLAAGGAWNGLADSDNDEIPDVFENGSQLTDGLNLSTIGFDPKNARSFPGFCCGDDEEVFNTILAQNERGTHRNDWANRGKQSNPSYLREVVENGTNASLIGNYSDFGIDIDADGLYDFLAISAQVDVVSAGTYTLMGKLLDSKSNVQSTFNFSYLNPGINNVILLFSGQAIRRNRVNGPFILTDVVLFTKFSEDEGNQTGNFTTSFYNYKQFEPLDAELTGTFSETAVDTDGNSLFNFLKIDVGINVSKSGTYRVRGELKTDERKIVSSENITSLTVGEKTVTLFFNGNIIRAHRTNGPYNLGIVEVIDSDANQTDALQDAFNTSAYTYTQFEKPKIEFTGIFGDLGIDTDLNSLFDLLRITAEVDINETGNYSFSAHLWDPNYTEITFNSTDLQLSPGIQNISVDLDGSAIGDHGVNGPYKLTSMSLHDADGVMLALEVDSHETQAYSYTQFEKGGKIIGRVLAYNSTSLENVTVFLSGVVSLVTQTNSTGNYSFEGLKPGSHSLFVISSDPNLKTNYTTISLAKGQTLAEDFVLDQAGSISGYVMRIDGTPIPNVTLYWEAYEPPRFVTDENGFYIMPNLDAGTYVLHADPPAETGLMSGIKTVEVVLGETTIANFTLIRGANITGIVTDNYGNPVANAYVYASGPYYGYAYTNFTGGYLITMLGIGNYTVDVDPPFETNLLPNSTTVEIVTEETVIADIILPIGGILTGFVTFPNGTPVYNAYVTASGPSYGSDYTDVDGNYTIIALETGTYSVSASFSGYPTAYAEVNVTRGETIVLDIILYPYGRLEGYLISPPSEVNKNQFFGFSAGVRCVDGSCGDVNAILDPSTVYDNVIISHEFETGTTFWVKPGDDEGVNLTLPFTFNFYGNDYTDICVSSNGWIQPGGGTVCWEYSFPDSVAYLTPGIYGIATDLNPQEGGDIKLINTTEKVVIHWDNVQHYGGGYPESFQIVLYPNGTIKINYGNISLGGASGITDGTGYDYFDVYESSNGPSYLFCLGDCGYGYSRKGIIPMDSGTPFYTIDQNPLYYYYLPCLGDMQMGQSCNMTWSVKATGDVNSTWQFFVVYQSSYLPNVMDVMSDIVNINITQPEVALTITVFSPVNNTSYYKIYVPLNFTVEPEPDWIGYSLNGQDNETITGNTTLNMSKVIDASLNNVTVFANDTSGNMGSSDPVYFFYCSGDVDKNKKVDIVDVVKVAIVYGKSCGDEDYDPDADLNDDCDINIVDVVIVALEFGKTC